MHRVFSQPRGASSHLRQQTSRAKLGLSLRNRLRSTTVFSSTNKGENSNVPVSVEDPIATLEATLAANANTSGLIEKEKVKKWKWEETDDAFRAYAILFGVLAVGSLDAFRTNSLADFPYFVALAVTTQYIGSHRALTSNQRTNISLKQGVLAPIFASVSLLFMYLILKVFPNLDIQTILNIYFGLVGGIAVTGGVAPLLAGIGRQVPGLGKRDIEVPEGLFMDEDGNPATKMQWSPLEMLALPIAAAVVYADISAGHNNYTLNNVLATLIACDLLSLISLRSFKTAAVLLIGMLTYDVVWVFGSPAMTPLTNGESVMVEVATSNLITGPLKLLFPRPGDIIPGTYPFQVLGLGDIAIPGLLAGLALRYDASRTVDMGSRAYAAGTAIIETGKTVDRNSMTSEELATMLGDAAESAYERIADQEDRRRAQTFREEEVAPALVSVDPEETGPTGWLKRVFRAKGDDKELEDFDELPQVPIEVMGNRPYFWAVLGGYLAGIVVTFGVNAVTRAGQPALLYLVPFTLGAVLITAEKRKEFGKVWAYTDRTVDYLKKLEKRDQERAQKKRKEEEEAKKKGSK